MLPGSTNEVRGDTSVITTAQTMAVLKAVATGRTANIVAATKANSPAAALALEKRMRAADEDDYESKALSVACLCVAQWLSSDAAATKRLLATADEVLV